MKIFPILAVGFALSLVSSANAARLVVTSVQTHTDNVNIPLPDQLVTFGIQVSQFDLSNAGSNPVLFVQNLTFLGNGIDRGPLQGASSKSGSKNAADVQSIQTNYIDNITDYPPTDAGLAAVSFRAPAQLYADSWWYSSSGAAAGTLFGLNDVSGSTMGTVTTNPNTTLGGGFTGRAGTAAVGTTGYLWQPLATGIVGGLTSFSTMSYTGLFGPIGGNSLTALPLSGQFVNGFLTVPLAQILTSGNIYFPGDSMHSGANYTMAAGGWPVPGPAGPVGSGTYILVGGDGVSSGPTGNGTYNIAGGNPLVDPGQVTCYYYSFTDQGMAVCPEPSTWILAVLGVAAIYFASRRQTVRNA